MRTKVCLLTAVLLLTSFSLFLTANADRTAVSRLVRVAEYKITDKVEHKTEETFYEYGEDGNLSAAVFTEYQFYQGVNKQKTSYRTEYESDGRQIGLPDDVRDSLDQKIPVDELWFEEYYPVIVTEQKDNQGRVTQITRTQHEGRPVYRFSYEYDEQGRFSSFCYEDLREFSLSLRTRNKGSFTYYEDGSRDILIEFRYDDIWIVGTLHYDTEGHLNRFDGRNLDGMDGIGRKIDWIYNYWIYDGVHGMYFAHIGGNEDLETDGSDHASKLPERIPMISETSISHLPDPEIIAHGGKTEYDDNGNLVRANYYNRDGNLYRYIEFEYAG